MVQSNNKGIDTPRISIVVPVFDSEKTIGRCIESILEQTYAFFELIIVDDGSTDGSLEVCSRYVSDERVRVLPREHRGSSAARNAALDAVTGDYLMFVDADDTLVNMGLEVVLNAILLSKTDLCIFGWNEISEYKTITHTFSAKELSSSTEEVYKSVIFSSNSRGGGFLWNKIWRVSRLRKSENFITFDESITLYEDKLWILENLNLISSVSFCNMPIYQYYINPNSVSHAWENKLDLLFDAYRAAGKIKKIVIRNKFQFVQEADKLCLLFLLNYLFAFKIENSEYYDSYKYINAKIEFKQSKFYYMGLKPTIKFVILKLLTLFEKD
jgi:glycosyltransferase involved in cell wall biosynthesis